MGLYAKTYMKDSTGPAFEAFVFTMAAKELDWLERKC